MDKITSNCVRIVVTKNKMKNFLLLRFGTKNPFIALIIELILKQNERETINKEKNR